MYILIILVFYFYHILFKKIKKTCNFLFCFVEFVCTEFVTLRLRGVEQHPDLVDDVNEFQIVLCLHLLTVQVDLIHEFPIVLPLDVLVLYALDERAEQTAHLAADLVHAVSHIHHAKHKAVDRVFFLVEPRVLFAGDEIHNVLRSHCCM